MSPFCLSNVECSRNAGSFRFHSPRGSKVDIHPIEKDWGISSNFTNLWIIKLKTKCQKLYEKKSAIFKIKYKQTMLSCEHKCVINTLPVS